MVTSNKTFNELLQEFYSDMDCEAVPGDHHCPDLERKHRFIGQRILYGITQFHADGAPEYTELFYVEDEEFNFCPFCGANLKPEPALPLFDSLAKQL